MRGAFIALAAAAVCYVSASTQQSAPVGGSTAPKTPSPQQVTSWLINASTLELVHLHEQYGTVFDDIHVSAFWSRIKQIAGAPRSPGRRELQKYGLQLLPACELTVVLLPKMNARRLATLCHTFASAGLRKGLPWSVVWKAFPAAAQARMRDFNAQALANTASVHAELDQAEELLFA